MAKNARQLCFDALCQVYRDKGYSSIVLDRVLKQCGAQPQEKTLAAALFYGVIERDLTLGYQIDRYSKRKCAKLDIEVAVILKMGLYQLLYLEQIPERAAVHETVSLCQYARKTSAKGFVNAILRAAIRDGKQVVLPVEDGFWRMSVRYSCPEWLLKQWAEEYSLDTAQRLAEASLGRPPLTVRVNTLKTSDEELCALLKKRGVGLQKNRWVEHCYALEHSGSLSELPEFQQGLFYVQDASSQFCAKILDAKPGMTVLDLCSAPGSKAFTVAQGMENKGELLAFDLYEHKTRLISDGAKRLGLDCIKAQVGDASVYREDLPKADRVLCDVPCAGLGIIRRKPEIKYKPRESLKDLPAIQRRILENGGRYVKPGGRLLYSTCSLSRAENEAVAEGFLKAHPEFEPVDLETDWGKAAEAKGNMLTFFPHLIDSDGFFIALFERKGEKHEKD